MSPIIAHPDVRRMLLAMKAQTQAARMICFATAHAHDMTKSASDDATRIAAEHRTALLTPIAKAYATDIAVEVASLGVQVHGGMGYVEETGAAQYLRDARILPIYEGTNGIQAIDLVTRKLPLDGGKTVANYLLELAKISADVRASNRPELGLTGTRLSDAIRSLQAATEWIGRALETAPEAALASATPYLRLFALTAGAAYLAKGALRSAGGDPSVSIARFFAENILTQAQGLTETITTGADAVLVDDQAEVFA